MGGGSDPSAGLKQRRRLQMTMLVASSAVAAGLFVNNGEFAGEDGVARELDC